MPFSGGAFTKLFAWLTDPVRNEKIFNSRLDDEFGGIAVGLSTCILKDGTSTTSARIPLAQGIGLGDGTAAAPAITFTSDADTGLHRIGPDTLGLDVGGSTEVAIGTANVALGHALSVAGAATLSSTLAVAGQTSAALGTQSAPAYAFTGDTNTGLYSPAADILAISTGGAERGRWTNNAVCIGTPADTLAKLVVAQSAASTPGLWFEGISASYTSTVARLQSATAASSAFSFLWTVAAGDIKHILRGDGNGLCDGAWTGGGADYAEYFESQDGVALAVGRTVVLIGDKVRAATALDRPSDIIGVVRPKSTGARTPALIGNAAPLRWQGKYLSDAFGRYMMQPYAVLEWDDVDPLTAHVVKRHSYPADAVPADIVIPPDATLITADSAGAPLCRPQLNPRYDPGTPYMPREQRPEWNLIGLLGQVAILTGQPTGERWRKMRDIAAGVEEWLIR